MSTSTQQHPKKKKNEEVNTVICPIYQNEQNFPFFFLINYPQYINYSFIFLLPGGGLFKMSDFH